MFGIPPITKRYVVIAELNDRDWYLSDANRLKDTTVREWTAYLKDALMFDNKQDAEQIAEIICPDDIDYKIGGISTNAR